MGKFSLFLLLAVVIAVAFFYLYSKSTLQSASRRGRPSPDVTAPAPQTAPQVADSPAPVENENAPEEAAPPAEAASPAAEDPVVAAEGGPSDFGTIRPISGKANAQAASVLEALKTGQFPERLSPMIISDKPFDKSAFEADPDAYLSVIEPGRVFVTMDPSPEVPALRVVGERFARIKPGESVKLSVQGTPNSPLTFTATDLGTFVENQLNCISVKADPQGYASVTFIATPGALNDCNILVGSPLSSGQAKFKVVIEGEPKNKVARSDE